MVKICRSAYLQRFDRFILLTSLMVVHLILMSFYVGVLIDSCGVWNFNVYFKHDIKKKYLCFEYFLFGHLFVHFY